MRGSGIPYSPSERHWLKANRRLPRKACHLAFCQRFDRSDVSYDNIKAFYTRMGWKTGRTGRYAPGDTPLNKGKKMPFNANSARTQFKPGQLPRNVKYLGHERLSKDGYVEISIAERNPHTGFERRYVHKHRYLWMKKHGPIPKGHALKCLNGDKKNCNPENWVCIPRALLPRLNGRFGRNYDTAPAELKPIIMKIAKLEHQAREHKNKRKSREQHND